jgi:alkanesulfonate monooxygenase SsuD/methylene tetrahydromethanopterin reductase-like flavin-dependent oxidoreductase (luciferase family)
MKIGIMPSVQRTNWQAIRSVVRRIDELNYDSLWCPDHLAAPPPWPPGGTFECLASLAAWASLTDRVSLGSMVCSIAFRNPGVLAKTVTTIDHISGGRVCLGVGTGWYEAEHLAYRVGFGSPAQRVHSLSEGLKVLVSMLRESSSTEADVTNTVGTPNLPPPLNGRVPILIGGQGDRMLNLVAEYADIWNASGPLATVIDRQERLIIACHRTGRDRNEIERTYHVGPAVIRDSAREAERRFAETADNNGFSKPPTSPPSGPVAVGTVGEIAGRLKPFLTAGFTHMYFDLLSPYDEETLIRLPTELRDALS